MSRARRPAAAAVLLLVLAGCARKGPPSGGPADLVPPRVVSSEPDSGRARVPLDARLSVTFSEGMDHVCAGLADGLPNGLDAVLAFADMMAQDSAADLAAPYAVQS